MFQVTRLLLVFLEHFCYMRILFFRDIMLYHFPEEQNPQLHHCNNLKTCISVTRPLTYKLSFHFKLQHFQFAQFTVWSGDQIPVGARFSAPIQTGPGAHPASNTMGTMSFPGVKLLGRGIDHPHPSRAKVKERAELYLYSPSGPSWPVLG
jgi:hypothetical protein